MSSEQSVTESPVQPSAPAAAREDSSESGSGNGAYEGGYELDESGQRVPHGMGQSKSSRRRRRKRKGKGSEAGAPGGASGQNSADGADIEPSATISVMAGEAPAPVNPPMRTSNSQSYPQGRSFSGPQAGNGAANQANGSGGQLNGAPGTKRWKKKFRDRDRPRPAGEGSFTSSAHGSAGQSSAGPSSFRGPDTHQPGNSSFKRKGGFSSGGKQRSGGSGSRGGFVGPMDHSYRATNGNVFETPPATIDPYGNGNGHGGGRSRSYHQSDSQPIDYSQGRAIPIAADAPTKIYFFIEDLFFIAKISETARKLGVKVAFAKNEKEQIAALTDASEDDRPGLIVFDLNNANAKPMTLIPKLKTKLKKTTSIIGFLSHLQGDLKAKAVEAGCDTVMPRAAFSQNLPNLLRRYGIEEVEELNYNQ